MTKVDMARYIYQALYRLPAAPAPDHPGVQRMARRTKSDDLERQYRLALKVFEQMSAAT